MERKVTVMGAGRVGATTAQLLAYREICDVVLWNRTEGTAKGIALDIKESSPLEQFDSGIIGTSDFNEIKGSDVVVLTAGVPRKEGMSREELLSTNATVVKALCDQIRRNAPDCKLIVLTNPLDAMVYLAKRVTGFPRERIVGMAGMLDSARYRTFIADALKVSVKNVSGMVLGSHGDMMVPLVSSTSVEGVQVKELLSQDVLDKIIQRTRDGGAEIISLEKDSSAFYAPASSLVAMVESILEDRKEVLPCSAYLTGEYGINGIFIGVPVVLGRNGVEKIIELKLTEEENKELRESAEKARGLVKQVDVLP